MSHRCLREEKNGEWETRRNGTPTGYANGRWGGAEGWGMNLMCAWVQGAWVGYMILDGLLRVAPDLYLTVISIFPSFTYLDGCLHATSTLVQP
jgi:hypothetical protein